MIMILKQEKVKFKPRIELNHNIHSNSGQPYVSAGMHNKL